MMPLVRGGLRTFFTRIVLLAAVTPGCIVYVNDEPLPCETPGDCVERDAGAKPDSAPPVDAPNDAPGDAAPDGPLVDVGHRRELRGVWVASVFNIDWPSRTAMTETDAKAELTRLLDAMRKLGANAINLQIRPASDALYASTLEPWSRVLSGIEGVGPGWDPLAYAVTEAHARGLELHAWLNPYRAASNKSQTLAPNHVAKVYPAYAYPYGTALVMDPGAKVVRDHVTSVVRDIVRRYDVDGIVFDDYFYPYPVSGVTFPDDATYAAYTGAGGTLSRSDWRRQNVNEFIGDVSAAIAAEKPWVRFGVSPFGIWRPGNPAGVTGLDAYETLSSDALAWLDGGFIDYVAPQLYWTTTSTGQPFGALLDWWTAQASARGRWAMPALNVSKIGTTDWSLDEYRKQLTLIRAANPKGATGAVLFSAKHLVADAGGLASMIGSEAWSAPALPPPLSTARSSTFDPPTVTASGDTVMLSHEKAGEVRGYAVYSLAGGAPTLTSWTRRPTATITPGPGTWAISAVDARGVESRGVRLSIP